MGREAKDPAHGRYDVSKRWLTNKAGTILRHMKGHPHDRGWVGKVDGVVALAVEAGLKKRGQA